MRDEPGPGVFAEVIKHVGEWKRLGVTGIAAMSGQAALRVGYVHSVWIVLAGHITPELQHEAERLGAQVWTYDYNLRTTNTEANRFFSGLYTWSLGLSGNIPYAYMGEPNHQPYFDANWKLSRPSILGYVIPSPAGPVPGVGFEGRREGVDDVRYLQLLEARIEAAGENNRTAKEARDWLTNLRKKSHTTEFHTYYYNCWGADFMDPHSGIDPEDYDTIRVRAARFIIGLPPAEGELNAEPSEWMRMTAEPLESDAFADASLKECLKALKTGTINEKRQAASALALRDGKEILPARDLLISLLDLPDVRIVALRALLNLGPDAAPAIPKLNSMLESKDAFIRCGVICVLTSIGQEAVETLTRCVNDPEKSLANFARESLKNLSK